MSQASIFSPIITKGPGDHRHWGELTGASQAMAIAHAQKTHQKPVVVITADTPTALKLEDELHDFCDSQVEVMLFSDWETLPYDTFSPHQDIISQRLRILHRLESMTQAIVLIPITTLMLRVAPPSYLHGHVFIINRGQNIDQHGLRQKLEHAGYRAVEQVIAHGEFAARGSIFDVFPMGSNKPFRLDFFDDEIDSIRLFDIESQRSLAQIDKIDVLPAHEFPTNKAGIDAFRQNWREHLSVSNDKESVYQQVSKQLMPAGIEYYLPLFFDTTARFTDYLAPETLLIGCGNLPEAAERFWHDIEYRYEDRNIDIQRPLLRPDIPFIPVNEVFSALRPFARIDIHTTKVTDKAGRTNFAAQAVGDIALNHTQKEPLRKFQDFIASIHQAKGRVLINAESEGRRETLLELLAKENIKPTHVDNLHAYVNDNSPLAMMVSRAEQSFVIRQGKPFAFITEAQLLGDRVSQRRRRKQKEATNIDAMIKNLAELQIGQPVVHIEHGVGRYLGLQTLDAGGMTTEFLTLEYAGHAKLYVPVANLHLISRYSGGDTDHAPIHKLGSDSWSKARKKAAEKVRDVAAELLDIYANRESKTGYAFSLDKDAFRQFSDGFPFEETADQRQAINAVSSDMTQKKAMDRLVCGDVGFGKTEVAMRAAFMAVHGGKQVSVLVPTTLLAQQHFDNFRDRFAQWPVRIEVLSRFKTAKEQKAILEDVKNNKVDILIGTHKLLQDDIGFANLGLLIVDEEHRFGVRQKEKIKKLRADVDILTMTATPIPRTLNMAMSGMRDLSIIATPPAKRLAVKTFVRQRDDLTIKEAILREIMRGGQVYFLHNNVDTIENTAQEIRELIPEARVDIGHGQMRERELEKVMSDFYHQRFNVLVCTTIIETGIDIPSANTIIMDRADHLGLAQLHQLRGRVGRSHHQAYAYLLTPHPKRMTKDAQKRLDAISQLEDLGAGFALATHDLEIRGAGELLGEDQSGQIATIGFSLYMEMLEEAVEALKNGQEPSLDHLLSSQCEVDLKLPALIPDDYIHDVATRLSMYKRIASCANDDALDDIQVEMIDRFGLLPDASKNLVKVSSLKNQATKIGIRRIDAHSKGGSIEFHENPKVDPGFIIGLVQQQPRIFQFAGANRLKFNIEAEDTKKRIDWVERLVKQLSSAAA